MLDGKSMLSYGVETICALFIDFYSTYLEGLSLLKNQITKNYLSRTTIQEHIIFQIFVKEFKVKKEDFLLQSEGNI